MKTLYFILFGLVMNTASALCAQPSISECFERLHANPAGNLEVWFDDEKLSSSVTEHLNELAQNGFNVRTTAESGFFEKGYVDQAHIHPSTIALIDLQHSTALENEVQSIQYLERLKTKAFIYKIDCHFPLGPSMGGSN